MDREFWSTPHLWPDDPHGLIFLARAFDHVGRALAPTLGFGDWIGTEAAGQDANYEKVNRLLRSINQTGEMPPEGRRASDALHRVAHTLSWFFRVCKPGDLPAFVQNEASGEITPVPRCNWNIEKIYSRFRRGTINLADPGSQAVEGDGFGYLFFDCIKFEALLAELKGSLIERDANSVPPSPIPDVSAPKPRRSTDTQGLFGADVRWSLDQFLAWLAEREETCEFYDAWSNGWCRYLLGRGNEDEMVALKGAETRAVEALRNGRISAYLPDNPNRAVGKHWFAGKALTYADGRRAVFRDERLYLPGPEHDLRLSCRQTLCLYPPRASCGENPLTEHDVGIYPLAVAVRMLTNRTSTEPSISAHEASKAALAAIKQACLNGRLQLYGYAAQVVGETDDWQPCEEAVEPVPPNRIRSLHIEPYGGQPLHEHINGRPWRDYGHATQYNEFGALRWTGLHFDRVAFDTFAALDGNSSQELSLGSRNEENDTAPESEGEHIAASRRRGAVSLAEMDEPLLKEMNRLIQNKEAPSVLAAAGMVVGRASGHGSEDSKLTRLRKRYAQRYP